MATPVIPSEHGDPCHPERAQRVEGSALGFLTESTENTEAALGIPLALSAGPSKPFGLVDGEEPCAGASNPTRKGVLCALRALCEKKLRR